MRQGCLDAHFVSGAAEAYHIWGGGGAKLKRLLFHDYINFVTKHSTKVSGAFVVSSGEFNSNISGINV